MKKLFVVWLAFIMLAAGSYAQPTGNRQAPPKMKDPSEMAKEKADRMQKEIALDKKQYKKVYKLFKKDFEYRQQAMQSSAPGGMPPQGGGPGMGGPGMGGGDMMGGGPGMGGGMPPQGGGMMGGGPGMGGPGMGGEMPPQGGMQPGGDLITDEYLEKQDAKLRKILSADQYDKWRAKHPAEHLELPPMELPSMEIPSGEMK